METLPILAIGFTVIIALFFLAYGYEEYVKSYRRKMIDRYQFPRSISAKVLKTYPELKPEQVELILKALREYFHILNFAGKNKNVAMPSQAVDVAWHEFILFTKEYQNFCRRALGRFIHHTPAEAMKNRTFAQEGIKRAWRLACFRESINPKHPHKLPLLFALDAQLAIADGFVYELNCRQKDSGQCASHIGCSTGSSGGGSSGMDSAGGDGGGSGCGGS